MLLGIVIAGSSGVPGLFFARNSMSGQWVATLLSAVAAGSGLAGVGLFWATGVSQPISAAWPLLGADFSVAVDGLSAVFLVPIFLLALLGSVYGLAYWKQTDHEENGRRLRFFYGTVTAGMALLVIAQNSILFLFGWEIMALSAFFLVCTEGHKKDVLEAGVIYLMCTHAATLCLFALFALMRAASGSFAFVPLSSGALTPGMETGIFVLALFAFGVKAGLMPLHIWLPGAHAMAPSHVSALMSGVLIKMGIYGLVRVTSLLPVPRLEWGGIVLALGLISGVLGVAFAIGQHDIKRLLAYHSIENIGIIVMGLGVALIGRALARADWVVLGLCGSLLHVWNHAFFKALLFLSAGSVIHAVHTREIDHLGGLSRRMPWTAWSFLVGAVAICGLPPLNGFVSELLVYLGLFATLGKPGGPSCAGAAFGAPALALIGALAVACFVKVYGAVFLGTARSDHAPAAHEAPLLMLGPQAVLVACCVGIGLAPHRVAPVFDSAVAAWAPALPDARPHLAALAPLDRISAASVGLTAALLVASALLWARLRRQAPATDTTWGCGYIAPTARMQYTASSFAQMLVALFGWALRPRVRAPRDLGLFPPKSGFATEVPDAVLDRAVLPLVRFGGWLSSGFRVLHQGSIQVYVLYIFAVLVVLLIRR